MDPFPQDLDCILKRVEDLCATPEKKFIYAYWNEPDNTMHLYGPESNETRDLMIQLENRLEEFSSNLSDTLLIITADHSQIESKNYCINDYPDITRCLVRMPSIEPRALNFFVKEEYKQEFPKIFADTFKDKFLLLTKEEIIESNLFGIGKEHALFRDLLGDYIVISIADASLFVTHKEASMMPGGHAGWRFL